MKNIDLEDLCSVIAGLSGIPVRIFDGSFLIYYSFVGRLPRDPLEICKKEVFAMHFTEAIESRMTEEEKHLLSDIYVPTDTRRRFFR